MPREMTIRDAAVELGVSERTVNRMIDDGRLASFTDGRRRIVVMPDAVVADDNGDAPTAADAEAAPEPTRPRPTPSPVVELEVLRARLALLERENERLWRLVEGTADRPPLLLPATVSEPTGKAGLWARLKAYFR